MMLGAAQQARSMGLKVGDTIRGRLQLFGFILGWIIRASQRSSRAPIKPPCRIDRPLQQIAHC
jgi:hypothetical protein